MKGRCVCTVNKTEETESGAETCQESLCLPGGCNRRLHEKIWTGNNALHESTTIHVCVILCQYLPVACVQLDTEKKKKEPCIKRVH